MGQVSSKLRRATDGYYWFCPACQEMHPLPDGWIFNGDVEKPTFAPSFRHSWNQHGGALGLNPKHRQCHYSVTEGRVVYYGDSTHSMAGQTIDMPDLPSDGENQ